jgi:hypothetical protein
MIYCEIIIVRGGPMFVDFVDHPCPQIHIPTNLHPHKHGFDSFVILIKYHPNCIIY